jgi:hypothetical protein
LERANQELVIGFFKKVGSNNGRRVKYGHCGVVACVSQHALHHSNVESQL